MLKRKTGNLKKKVWESLAPYQEQENEHNTYKNLRFIFDRHVCRAQWCKTTFLFPRDQYPSLSIPESRTITLRACLESEQLALLACTVSETRGFPTSSCPRLRGSGPLVRNERKRSGYGSSYFPEYAELHNPKGIGVSWPLQQYPDPHAA